jgi:hypothetical protein
MDGRDFIWGYLPFWVVNYGLAIVLWSCIGRFLLSFFISRQPSNYIWLAFRALTDWAVAASSWLTPRFVHPSLLPLIAAFWIAYLRIAAFAVMWNLGLTPRLGLTG